MEDEIILLAEVTAQLVGAAAQEPVRIEGNWRALRVEVVVTEAGFETAGKSLIVRVQSSNEGEVWDDACGMTEVGSDGAGVNASYATLQRWQEDQAGETHAIADGSTAAGTVKNVGLGPLIRCKCTVAEAGGPTASYTYRVTAALIR